MNISKWYMGAIVAGAVALGSTLSVSAQDAASTAAPAKERPGAKMGHRGGPETGPFKAELSLPGKDGGPVVHVRMDAGVLKSSDASSVTITTPEGDVTVPVSESTKVNRDGSEANLSDLKAGDHVRTKRTDASGTMQTVHIGAISPERLAEMQAKREACKADPQVCRKQMQERGGPGHRGPRGDAPPGADPAGFTGHRPDFAGV